MEIMMVIRLALSTFNPRVESLLFGYLLLQHLLTHVHNRIHLEMIWGMLPILKATKSAMILEREGK